VTDREHELFVVLRQIRMDATAIQAKVTDALNMASSMSLPQVERTPCPRCGMPLKGGDQTLALHIQNVHDGPLVPLTPEEEIG